MKTGGIVVKALNTSPFKKRGVKNGPTQTVDIYVRNDNNVYIYTYTYKSRPGHWGTDVALYIGWNIPNKCLKQHMHTRYYYLLIPDYTLAPPPTPFISGAMGPLSELICGSVHCIIYAVASPTAALSLCPFAILCAPKNMISYGPFPI